MNRLQEIRQRQTELRASLLALGELDTLDDEQNSRWASDTAEWDTLEAEAAPLQERSDRLNAIRNTAAAVSGDGANRAEFNVITRDADDIYRRDDLHVTREADGHQYRERAVRAIDSWKRSIPAAYRESALALVENAEESERDRRVADHIIHASNPVYAKAFGKFLRGRDAALWSEDERRLFAEVNDGEIARALSEGSAAVGQALVPPFLDPTIILTNTGVTNPFRRISTVRSITTQTWKGVTTAGVTAEWTSEASEVTDASPSLVQPTITPARADAYVQASFEMLEDTSIGTDLAMLFADARDRLEGAAFATGSGSNQPYGIVTELELVTNSRVSANTNGTIGLVDVYNLDSNLGARWRDNASWVANKGILNTVRQVSTAVTVSYSPWQDMGAGLPAQLIGYPVYQASGMQSSLSTATASNDDVLILGDFRQYFIIDRIGMGVAYNPLVLGANRRPTLEVGWVAYWRTGARTVNADAFRMLRV